MRRTPVHLIAVTLALVAQTARGEDVVQVTGERALHGRPSRDQTAASSVVGEDELRRAGASVGEALRAQPGVEVRSAGASSDLTTALVRGASSAELPVYLAGVRINDDLTGSADLSSVPAWMLRRVEIYRGNAPADADRLGLGGAIFLEPKLPRGTTLGGTLGAGSFGWRTMGAFGGAGDDSARALVAIRREDAENDYPYRDDRGTRLAGLPETTSTRRNADAHATDAWAIARFGGEGAEITAIVNGFTREQGIPGVGVAPTLAARMRTTRALAAVRSAIACGERCDVELATSALRSAIVLAPNGDTVVAPRETELVGERVEPSARIRFAPIDELGLHAAVDAARESLAIEPASAIARARRDFLRVAAQADATPTEWLLVSALADVEASHTVADRSPATDVAPLGARASVRVGDDRLALLANVGRYARVPTLGELYGQSAIVRGNPSLAPERGETADVGVRARRGFSFFDRPSRIELDAFAYGRNVRDLVAYERSSFGQVEPFNVGKARVLGAELALSTELARRARVDESLTLEDPRDVTSGRTLVNDVVPLRSRLVDSTALTALLGDLVGLRRAEIGGRVLRVSSRYADAAGLVVVPAQTTFDLDAAVGFLAGPLDLVVRGRLANVFDAQRFDFVGYPQPGRAAYVTLDVAAE